MWSTGNSISLTSIISLAYLTCLKLNFDLCKTKCDQFHLGKTVASSEEKNFLEESSFSKRNSESWILSPNNLGWPVITFTFSDEWSPRVSLTYSSIHSFSSVSFYTFYSPPLRASCTIKTRKCLSRILSEFSVRLETCESGK
jgi:hypothetical protein